MKLKDNLPNLNDSFKIKNANITINNIDLPIDIISDIQIDYGKTNKGKITFIDSIGIIELSPLTFGIVRINFLDLINIEYNAEFIITKTYINRNKSGYNKVTVYFKNMVQYDLEKTYISKTFKDSTLPEMLSEIFNELEIPCFFGVDKSSYKYEYFVFPKNISLWEFLNKYLKYAGYDYYFDTGSFKIISRKFLEAPKKSLFSEDSYYFNYNKENSFFTIIEYAGTFSNPERVNEMSSYNKNKFKKELKYEFDFKGPKTIEDAESINGAFIGTKSSKISDVYNTIGYREIDELEPFEIIGFDEDYRDIGRDNQDIQIIVQGSHTEKLYKTVKIKIPGPKNVTNDNTDSVSSGIYIVTKVVYKIISGLFVQVLTLKSLDYPKGNSSVWK